MVIGKPKNLKFWIFLRNNNVNIPNNYFPFLFKRFELMPLLNHSSL